MTSLIVFAAILLSVFPLCLFTELVGEQAGKAPVRSAWYLCLAASWLGGVALAYIGLIPVAFYLSRSEVLSDWLCYTLLLATGPLGGSVGPGMIYAYLRLRRTHDPDYEDIHRK